MSKSIRQTVTFKTDPHEVYEALLDQKKHSAFTGGSAKISRKVSGEFSIWDGDITGKILELVPDARIVQTWRYSDWPDGVFSTATFQLEKVENGTKLIFSQTGVPDNRYADIKQGWKDYYWQPLKEFFKK